MVRLRARSVRRLTQLRALRLVELPADVSVEEALRALREEKVVLYAEPDYVVRIGDTPNDAEFSSQWGLSNTGQNLGMSGADIDASAAWDVTTGSSQVVVGVLDSGFDYTHPDLAANVWSNPLDCDSDGFDDDDNGYADDCHGIDVLNGDSDPRDDNGHGTHVSGIIAAVGDNGIGVSGVAWRTSLAACKFLDERGTGYVSGAIACLDYFALLKERGVDVVATNNSWGGFTYSRSLREAVQEQMARGILFVAAAGNSFRDHDAYPTFPNGFSLPNVLAVAATDRNDSLVWFSDEGRYSIDLAAPGMEILSTTPGGAYEMRHGTSMAAPHVTGVAALLKAADPGADWRSIRNLILAGGDDLPELGRTVTGKRLTAFGALTCEASVVRSRLAPAGQAIVVAIGENIPLSFLGIECSAPGKPPVVALDPGSVPIPMQDDGILPDEAEGDGVFSGRWVPDAAGDYELVFPGDDRVAVRVLESEFPPHFSSTSYLGLPWLTMEALAIGDLNGDGLNDVVVTTGSSNINIPSDTLTVFLQNAAGGLDGPVAYYVGDPRITSLVTTVALGDLNGDMRTDAAFGTWHSSITGNFVGVLYQEPGGTLGPVVRYGTGNSERVAVGDLNHDGRTDLLAGRGAGTKAFLDMFLQDDAGNLRPPLSLQVDFPDPTWDIDLAVADVSGDGLDDIVVLARLTSTPAINSRRVAVLRQEPGGSFVMTHLLGDRTLLAYADSLAVGDLNGDGLADLAVALGGNRYATDPYVVIFHQDGTGSFEEPVRYPAFEIPHSVEIADIDQDGRNDVVMAHAGWGGVGTFFGTARGTLYPYVLDPLYGSDSLNHQALAVGDLNGDGRPDLAYANIQGRLQVLTNQMTAAPAAGEITIIKSLGGKGTVVSRPPGINCGPECRGPYEYGCGPTCRAWFPAGTRITFEAIPESTSTFEGWEGFTCVPATDGTCTTIFGPGGVIYAYFDYVGPRLTVSTKGAGTGAVRSDPTGIWCGMDCSEPYPWGSPVTLIAEAEPLSRFEGWGGRCAGTGPCMVPVDGPQSVEAWFHRPILLRSPNPAATYHADDPQPVFEWHPGTAEEFKVLWSRTATFGKSSLSTGKRWLLGEAFTPDPELWSRILRIAGGTGVAYWKVMGRDGSGSPESSDPGTILLADQQAPSLTAPADGRVFSMQDPAPALVWEPNHNESYRIVFSWRPDLKGKPKVQSGDGYTLGGNTWTIPDAAWERIKSTLASRGGGTVHYAIFGRDALGRTTRSSTYSLRLQ